MRKRKPKRKVRVRDPILQRAIVNAGGVTALAREIGAASHQVVSKWTQVPLTRLAAVARASGIPMEKLRPDLVPKIEDMRDDWRSQP